MFDHVAKSIHFHLFMFIKVAAIIFILTVYLTPFRNFIARRNFICNLIPNVSFSYS